MMYVQQAAPICEFRKKNKNGKNAFGKKKEMQTYSGQKWTIYGEKSFATNCDIQIIDLR